MAGLFGMRGAQTRTGYGAVELALDMTVEAITLYERAASGGWRKFAGAPLDDQEFQIVIGLVRSEAEKRTGGKFPVRLWLPSDQVLQRRTRISSHSDDARLAEAFRFIEAQTVFRPEDVALAVSPNESDGEATILITFAETWREARTYAERWGFIPGDVSTRHRAIAFGSDGPVFRLQRLRQRAPIKRRRLGAFAAAAGLGAGVAAAAASIWILMPLVNAPESEAPPAAPEVTASVTEAAAPPPAAPVDVPLPPEKPAPDPSFASAPLEAMNPNAASLEESLLALKGPQTIPSGQTSGGSLPEPVLNAVMRSIPNETPFSKVVLSTADASALLQGASPTPVQMAPWANLPKAPKTVAEALAPRPPNQPDPAGQEPEIPPAIALTQPAAALAPPELGANAGEDFAISAVSEPLEGHSAHEPGQIAPESAAPADPPVAPFTEAAPPVVTIIPPGATARLSVPMPRGRPGPGDKSTMPVVAGPPVTPSAPQAPQSAEMALASAAPGSLTAFLPGLLFAAPPAPAGPPQAPFAEGEPLVVTVIPPGSTDLPVPMPLARPGPGSNSKVPEIAAAPDTPPAPDVPLVAGIDPANAAADRAISAQPSVLVPVGLALAGPPAVPFAEAEPPKVTVIPPGSKDFPVPMPPARPGPGSSSKVPDIAAAPAAPSTPNAPASPDLGNAAASADPTILRQPGGVAPVQQALADPPVAPVTDGPPPKVTIIPPGSTASLPVPMPPRRPGSETPTPAGLAAGPAPLPDPSASAPLDHEQLVQQFAASAVDLGEDLTGLALPPQRPASVAAAAETVATGPEEDDADNLAALILPRPRPTSVETAAKSAASPEDSAPSRIGAAAPGQHGPPPGSAEPPPPDPNTPTEMAAMSSPKPPVRPARPLVPVKLPSASLLPVLGGTSSGKVRAAATDQGLPLDQTSLIGVLNLDGGRKALLRMPDGRYKSVVVGDLVDGWRVSAIGVDAMKFSKSGQDMTLQLVSR